MCNCSRAAELDKSSQAQSVDLNGVHFRGWNKYAGTYPTKMSTMVLILWMVHKFAGEFVRQCTFTPGGTNTLLQGHRSELIKKIDKKRVSAFFYPVCIKQSEVQYIDVRAISSITLTFLTRCSPSASNLSDSFESKLNSWWPSFSMSGSPALFDIISNTWRKAQRRPQTHGTQRLH